MREQEGRGCTAVAMAVDGRLVVGFAVSDPLKPEAAGVVAALHHMGLQVGGACPWHSRDTAAQIVECFAASSNCMSKRLEACSS